MNTKTYGSIAVAVAVVAGVILLLQNFDAGKVACQDIGTARAELQAQYDAGVTASVQVFAEERAMAEEQLSRCLSAEPVDPCAEAQKARDAAVKAYEGIPSPADNAPYAEFQKYFKKRDNAYNAYKKAKDALDQCRTANPPKGDVPYEQSDTKACFDAYDASMKTTQETFTRNTQAMRTTLTAALSALDAREKACNPPTGKDKFTAVPGTGGTVGEGGVSENILKCQPLDSEFDAELSALRQQEATLNSQIQSAQTSIENAQKRMNKLQVDLAGADTYIPPESTKTQFEGALNALRGERKAAIQAGIDFYRSLIERKQAEKSSLEEQLKEVQAKISERLAQIKKENDERQRKYPTAVHQAKPDECGYYHCHGMLCGLSDPDPHGCGHGATTQDDTECKAFFKAYLEAGGGS